MDASKIKLLDQLTVWENIDHTNPLSTCQPH